MNPQEQKNAAQKFVERWSGKGYEKGETQPFWLMLLREVFGVYAAENFIFFEEQVKVSGNSSAKQKLHTNFIDARIPQTKVLIEQKSSDKDLDEPGKQADGSFLTPFQQAEKYAAKLPWSQRPRWIVVCNFKEFRVHDMETPNDDPVVVRLEELPEKYRSLSFLVQYRDEKIVNETNVSIAAGEIVGKLYDAFLREYKTPESLSSQRSLNMLCVRLVFCLYAEDAGVFADNQFHDYLTQHAGHARDALIKLFQVLDQKPEKRDPYLEPELAAFPYVNGGLFRDENIEIPTVSTRVLTAILRDASEQFDWKNISPTIFGAVFESTLNPETRRQGGMHYTSIENIHKVIDPLFLDELREEFEAIREIKLVNKRRDRLVEFQEKLGALTFLDPACGSGNFLTETYLSLRRLENEALRLIYPKGTFFSASDRGAVVKVSIDQFYGIEINDFAVSVAKTALWIAESQMLQETEGILNCQLDFLPLTNYDNIYEGNALRVDWNVVVDKNKLSYIMGNPPFVGYSNQSAQQKDDVRSIYVDEKGRPYKTAGKIDYVSCWYFKACLLMQNTRIHAAFVSTNSITQGEQVEGVWKPLVERFNLQISFAHRTFRWDSEANLKAHVHCVIVGFQTYDCEIPKFIYSNELRQSVQNINHYLIDAPNVFIESRATALCHIPEMVYGNKPVEGGFLFLKPEERTSILKTEPELEPYIRQVLGSEEFINNKQRYCFWLDGVSPHLLRSSRILSERIASVKEFRLKSPKEKTRQDAATPWLFQEIRQPATDYLLVPKVSSERRRYIPIGFMDKDVISTDLNFMVPNATLYHFGILTSSVHMAWMRAVCGRLKSDYRYSAKIVYNNFPWPDATEDQQRAIAGTAQGILDARALYPDSSLAELTMPPELRKAHTANDRAVMAAYSFADDMPEQEVVAALMQRYQRLIEEK